MLERQADQLGNRAIDDRQLRHLDPRFEFRGFARDRPLRLRARGARVVMVPNDDTVHVNTERLLEAIDEETLIVPISHVIFRSAFIQDVEAIVEKAHRVGAYVLLDSFQATGTLPFDVQRLNVDFCTGGVLKWLCGGPGTAYLYVRLEHITFVYSLSGLKGGGTLTSPSPSVTSLRI